MRCVNSIQKTNAYKDALMMLLAKLLWLALPSLLLMADAQMKEDVTLEQHLDFLATIWKEIQILLDAFKRKLIHWQLIQMPQT